MPKISIIIPVYNAEQYLRKSLESIIKQTYQNIEIICIDDCSTDNSLKILEEYAKQDQKIKIIKNSINKGQAYSRNEGLKIANGKYIGFVDADDWIEEDTYETCVNIMKKDNSIDIVSWKVKIVNDNCSDDDLFYKTAYNAHQCNLYGKHYLTSDVILETNSVIWNKLFKKELIDDKHIEFPNGLIFEDTYFIYKYLMNSSYIFFENKPYYNYVRHKNCTLDNVYNSKTINNRLKIFERLYNYASENNKISKYKYLLKSLFEQFIYNDYLNANKKDKKKVINFAKCIIKNVDNNILDSSIINKLIDNKLYKIDYLKYPQFTIGNSLLGLQYYKKGDKSIKILFLGAKITINITKLLSIKNTNDDKHKIFRILGVKFKFRKKQQNQGYNNELLYKIQRTITASMLNQKTFSKYKNKYQGKSVVLVGCGPTLNKFKLIKDAIYVGTNRAFLYKDIQFNYLFTIDKVGIENYYEEFCNYAPETCTKFIGDQNLGIKWQIPESIVARSRAKRYKTCVGISNSRFVVDIDSAPIGNFSSVTLQAIQFILFTNPSKIYLVGIDCTSGTNGHFIGDTNNCKHRNENLINIDRKQISDWKKLKEFVKLYYPETEIISINPVGLEGIFKDKKND